MLVVFAYLRLNCDCLCLDLWVCVGWVFVRYTIFVLVIVFVCLFRFVCGLILCV